METRIREIRAERGWTVRRLAEESGVDKNTISEVERGLRNPNPITMHKLARALGVEVRGLFPLGQVPLPDFEDGQRKSVYRFTGEPRVTSEQLRERGIDANDSEVHFLNQYIELHERPPTGPVVTWGVKKEDEPVDAERVKTMLAFVLASGMLTTDETQAALTAVRRELVGTASQGA